MKTIVQKTVTQMHMIEKGDVILLGVSGGADSVCLLLLLKEMEEAIGFTLEAVHVEHGIRGEESLRDAEFVAKLCDSLSVPLHTVKVDVPSYAEEHSLGLEEAARVLRYDAFVKLARGKKAKVALAHHMDDNAETILFQMLRGSSINGLCGMQPIREDEKGVVYIRPLLRIRRRDIEKELNQRVQSYCVDSTNSQVRYSRNYIRRIILPHLEKINDQAVEHISRSAEQLTDIRDFVQQEMTRVWHRAVLYSGEDELILDIDALIDAHSALQKEIVLEGLARMAGSRRDLESVHVLEVLKLCRGQSGREVALPYGMVAQKDFGKLRVRKESGDNASQAGGLEYMELPVTEEQLEGLLVSGEILEIPLKGGAEKLRFSVCAMKDEAEKIPNEPYTKWMDYDKIKQGFCIRTRRSGDYFMGDEFGHHKKLKQYFVDEKISASKRGRMPLLAQGPLVMWLVGYRISEHVKITADTKNIIKIEYVGEK